MNVFRRNKVFTNFVKGVVIDLPCSMKINYFWKFGSMLGVMFVFQLISGVFLSFVYNSDMKSAFKTVDLLKRDIWGGWVCRFIHLAGANSFFLYMYIHMGRGLYYMSFVHNIKVWLSGCSIFVLSMAIAFLGYVLPWGQMSYWGATVMTNFFSIIPFFGEDFVVWIWGGYAVGYPTITRFFSLHFLLPFILMVLVLIHMMLLHEKGSSKSLGCVKKLDVVEFHPFFIIKDLFGFQMIMFITFFIFFFYPDFFMESENYIEAKALVTPLHIQPEWYFLSAYAILRCIPKKMGGVFGLMFFMVVLYLYPFLVSKSFTYQSELHQYFFWGFSANFMLLSWLGACPVEAPYNYLARVSSFFYFLYFVLHQFPKKKI